MTPAADDRPPRSRGHRALRIVGASVVIVLGLAIGLVAAFLVLPIVREPALREGLRIADEYLPGTLAVESANWPRLGRIELAGATWLDAPDTLAAAERLELTVRLAPLLRGKYSVRGLHFERLRVDLPAIGARFAEGGEEPAPEAPARAPFDPDRLPKIVVDDLRVDDAQLRLTPTFEVAASALRLKADLRGESHPRTAELSGRVLAREELGAAFHLEAALDDSLIVRLAPVHLDVPAQLPDPSQLPLDGRLATTLADVTSLGRDEPWPRLSAQGVAITGALGDLELDAECHGRVAGHVSGRVAPQPPPPWLVDFVLAGTSDSLATRLRPLFAECWPKQAPPTVSWDAVFTPPATGPSLWPLPLAVEGEFVLPGPGELSPLLPERLRVSDLLGLRGKVAARYAGAGDSTRLHVDLDLAGTPWLSTGRVRLDTDTHRWVDVDSLALTLEGLALSARGRLDREHVDAKAVADVSSTVLARWDDPALRDIHGRFHVTVRATGTPRRPSLVADLNGQAEAKGLKVPAVSAHARLHESRLALALAAPQGLSYGPTVLDSLRLDADVRSLEGANRYAGEATLASGGRYGDFVVPRLNMTATLDDRHAVVAASFPSGASHGMSVVDSAHLDLDVTAHAQSFFPRLGTLQVSAAGHHGDIVVPTLKLNGRIADSTIALNVDLPDGAARGDTRMDSLHCAFAGGFRDTLREIHGRLDVAGGGADTKVLLGSDVELERQTGPPAVHARVDGLELRRGERGIVLQKPCNLAWNSADSLLQVEGLELRGQLGLLRGDLALAPQRVSGDVSWSLRMPMSAVRDLLPERLNFAAKAETVACEGRISLSGTAADPAALLTTSVELRDAKGAAGLAAVGKGWLRNPATTSPADWPAAPDDAPVRGLAAQLELREGAAKMLDASARFPGQVSLLPAVFRPDSSETGSAVARTHDLDLALLDEILPPGNRATGRLDLDAKMTGKPGAWNVDSKAEARKVALTFTDGSWLDVKGNLALRGPADSLEATGDINIGGGLLRVPETPPSLLPTSGELMLVPASAESVTATSGGKAETAARGRLPLAKADVRLKIPGNLWLRGRGLNVEIAGDLTTGTKEGRPVVEGDLRALQGNLKLLGHFFTLERGQVVFMDDVEALDPDLDIRMKTRVGDTSFFVEVVGSVQQPEIELSSEPQMSDEDIMSSLIFGKSKDELEQGQAGMMADRAGQVLASYGSVQLQDWASGQLGVDVVSIQPSEENQDVSSLVVGKYLQPNIVVRYERVMDEDSAQYVHMDYLWTSSFKVHTEIYDGGSGLELVWYVDR